MRGRIGCVVPSGSQVHSRPLPPLPGAGLDGDAAGEGDRALQAWESEQLRERLREKYESNKETYNDDFEYTPKECITGEELDASPFMQFL